MKLTCDLCGGELRVNSDHGVCSQCGIEYGPDRLGEKRAQQRGAVPVPKKTGKAKNMKIMWILLAMIGVAAFFGGWMESGIAYVVCLIALLITLFIFKPWKVYGGEET